MEYNLPPAQVLKYRLYKNKSNVFNHTYSFESAALYDRINCNFSEVDSARMLLSDKLKFANTLEKLNVPYIPTHLFDIMKLEIIYKTGNKLSYFIKTNMGSRSQDAFALNRRKSDLHINPITGINIGNASTVKKHLKKCIKAQNFIIQALLKNHLDFGKIFHANELITFRLITIKYTNESTKPLYLEIQIPKVKKDTHLQYCDLYLVHLKRYTLSQRNLYSYINTVPELSSQSITHIKKAVEYYIKAHKAALDCYSIGCDFCITPNSPIIIEGNYYWNIDYLSLEAQQELIQTFI